MHASQIADHRGFVATRADRGRHAGVEPGYRALQRTSEAELSVERNEAALRHASCRPNSRTSRTGDRSGLAERVRWAPAMIRVMVGTLMTGATLGGP